MWIIAGVQLVLLQVTLFILMLACCSNEISGPWNDCCNMEWLFEINEQATLICYSQRFITVLYSPTFVRHTGHMFAIHDAFYYCI